MEKVGYGRKRLFAICNIQHNVVEGNRLRIIDAHGLRPASSYRLKGNRLYRVIWIL